MYLIVSLVFSHLGFWSGNLFLIAPFPDLCLLVPFLSHLQYGITLVISLSTFNTARETRMFIILNAFEASDMSFIFCPPSFLKGAKLSDGSDLYKVTVNKSIMTLSIFRVFTSLLFGRHFVFKLIFSYS